MMLCAMLWLLCQCHWNSEAVDGAATGCPCSRYVLDLEAYHSVSAMFCFVSTCHSTS